MPDRFPPEVRSRIMSSIRSRDTRPEMDVRRRVWALGKRYRTHDRTVFGTPDMSNKSKRVAVFIDGCFWHGCGRCYTRPKTNAEFWDSKVAKNRERRKKVRQRLGEENWRILQFWEHEVKRNPDRVAAEIAGSL